MNPDCCPGGQGKEAFDWSLTRDVIDEFRDALEDVYSSDPMVLNTVVSEFLKDPNIRRPRSSAPDAGWVAVKGTGDPIEEHAEWIENEAGLKRILGGDSLIGPVIVKLPQLSVVELMRPLVAERFMCVASVDQSERFIGLVDRFAEAEAEGRQKYSQSSGCPSVHMV